MIHVNNTRLRGQLSPIFKQLNESRKWAKVIISLLIPNLTFAKLSGGTL